MTRQSRTSLRGKKYYVTHSGDIIKTVKVIKNKNKVIYYSLPNGENQTIDLDMAELIFQPVYTVSEVAKMVDRKPDTLRKYESAGLTDSPMKVLTSNGNWWRFYTERDVLQLAEDINSMSSDSGTTDMAVINRILSARKKDK